MDEHLQLQHRFHEWVGRNIRECEYIAGLCAATQPEEVIRAVEMVIVPYSKKRTSKYNFRIATLRTVWSQKKGAGCSNFKLVLSCARNTLPPGIMPLSSCECSCNVNLIRNSPLVLSVWTIKFRIQNSVRRINADSYACETTTKRPTSTDILALPRHPAYDLRR